MKTSDLVNEFLSVKRFAMIGVSRRRDHFSRKLFRDLRIRSYDVIPVNPATNEIEGVRCYRTLAEIHPTPTAALLMVPRSSTAGVLGECADAGATLVWVFGITGEKNVPEDARILAKERGIKLVGGYCPYMFMPMSAFYHRLHASILRMIGRFPS